MPFNNKNAYLNKNQVGADPGPINDVAPPPGPPGGTTGFIPNPNDQTGQKVVPTPEPGSIFGLKDSNAGGGGANDPLAALRGWLSSQGGAYRPDRRNARMLLRGLVGDPDSEMPLNEPLRRELIGPFMEQIRKSRDNGGLGSVAFLLNLLGYGAGQPPGGGIRFDNYRR